MNVNLKIKCRPHFQKSVKCTWRRVTVYTEFTKHYAPEGMLAEISFAPCVNLMPQGPLARCDCSLVAHHIQFPLQRLVWSKTSVGWWITHTFEMEALKAIQLLQSLKTCMGWPCVSRSSVITPFGNQQETTSRCVCRVKQEPSIRTQYLTLHYHYSILEVSLTGWIGAPLPPLSVYQMSLNQSSELTIFKKKGHLLNEPLLKQIIHNDRSAQCASL